jgi:hypothetical protein
VLHAESQKLWLESLLGLICSFRKCESLPFEFPQHFVGVELDHPDRWFRVKHFPG